MKRRFNGKFDIGTSGQGSAALSVRVDAGGGGGEGALGFILSRVSTASRPTIKPDLIGWLFWV